MNLIFLFAFLIILVTVPFWILIILLSFLKLFINFKFTISGLYYLTDIQLEFSTDEFSFSLKVESFKVIFGWPRTRFLIEGIKTSFDINKSEFKEQNNILGKNKINDVSFIKEKFSEMLKSKLWMNNNEKNNLLSFGEIFHIDDIVKHKKTSMKNRFVLYVLRFFDIYIERIKSTLKFTNRHIFYSIKIRKIITGVIKSPNKKSQIDIVGGLYDLEIREHIGKKLESLNNPEKKKILKRYVSNNIYINKHNNDDAIKYKLIKLSNLAFKVAFIDGFFPPTKTYSIMNKVSITIEGSNLVANISKRSVDNIISLIIGIILSINNNKENKTMFKNNKKNNASEDVSSFLKGNSNYNEERICIEQILLKKLESEMKKIEIKIQNMKVNLCNDNYIYKYLTIFCNNLKVERNSTLYLGNNINNDLHLIKREMELHFIEIKVFQYKNKQLYPVTDVPLFDLSLKDNIIYHSITQMSTITTNISGKLSNIELILTTGNVSKIIEVVLTIVDGIDIIEYVIKSKKSSKYKVDRELKDTTSIEIDLSNINAYIYNQDYYVNLCDVGLKMSMENIKGVSKLVTLDFSNLNLSFSPNLKDASLTNIITSNILIDGFKITIDDKKANGGERWYNINFADTLILGSDRHLLTIFQFVSDIADFILREEVDKKMKKRSGKYGVVLKKMAKKGTRLISNKIECVMILHEYDILHAFFENLDFILDDYITIPKAYMSHSTTLEKTNLYRKFIDIENFAIKYSSPTDFELTCDDFRINYYESYMARPMAHFILFFLFFPDWMEYYITYRFFLDKESQLEKYEITRNKIVKRKIKLTKFIFNINDNPVTAASILQARRDDLDKNVNSVVSYLKKIKADLLNLIFNEIDIELDTNVQVLRNLNNLGKDFNFYEQILINKKLELNIPSTKVNLEGKQIMTLGNIYYRSTTKKNMYNFNPNEILTELILYDRFVMIKKKISYDTKLDNEIIIKLDNYESKFKDTIVFDKTLTFITKSIKTIKEIPVKNCQTTVLSDKIVKNFTKTILFSFTRIFISINNVIPKTSEIYNTLDIKAKEINYLSEKELDLLEKIDDNSQISIHYFVISFSQKQKSGFPLFYLPLLELNDDSIKNILKVNIPTEIPPVPSESNAVFTEIYNEELNDLVIKTKSLTIFLNYLYVYTFDQIFNIFWGKINPLIVGNKKNESGKKDKENEINRTLTRRFTKLNTTKSSIRKSSPFIKRSQKNLKYNNNINITKPKKKKLIKLVLFDLKIIYLLEYKEEYKSIFSFHKFVEEHKYFGYIFRFYSFSLIFNNNNLEKDVQREMKARLQFLTVSFLDIDNLSDEPFFKRDSELKSISFNLKNIDNFNNFLGLNKENKSKLLNGKLDDFMIKCGYKEKRAITLKDSIINDVYFEKEYVDLTFDFRHTFLKIPEFNFFNQKDQILQENIKLILTNCKILWNKFNKDVFYNIIIYKDLFPIIDIYLKKKVKDKDKDKEKDTKGETTDGKQSKKNNKNLETNSNQIKEQSKENSTTTKREKSNNNGNYETESDEENIEEEQEEEDNHNNVKAKTLLSFEIINPQIVAQNEIKGSALLLMFKKPIKLVFINYLFRNDLKDYKLSVHCRQLSLYKVLKTDKKDSVIYWMGDPNENKYHLSEEDFGKILESPMIDFELSQNIESKNDSTLDSSNIYMLLNKKEKEKEDSLLDKSNMKLKENYEIKTKNEIIIDKISGNFISVYFDDFLNIIYFLFFDRGFSLSQEKKSDDQVKEDLKKFKPALIKTMLMGLLNENKISSKVKNEVKFILNEVTFNLCEDIDKLDEKNKKTEKKKNKSSNILDNFKPLLQFQMNEFLGEHTIRDDKSSETRIFVSKLLIKNVEHEMSQPVFQPLFNPNQKDLENRLKIITFMKKDRYIKLKTGSMWYILDEFDFNISPFSFHISKKQIHFIIVFFFHHDYNQWDEDKKKEEEKNKDKNGGNIYFRQFKIDEIKCYLNFEYSPEASIFNVPLTKLSMKEFLKYDKFYSIRTMVNRFIGHCKNQLISNFPNILSSLFSSKSSSNEYEKKEKDKEAKKRKLLFGDK